VDEARSHEWLNRAGVFPEIEGFMFAIQDQVIATRNYRRVILKEDVQDKCRRCGTKGETIQHILNGCATLAPQAYKERHDSVGKILHLELKKKIYGPKSTTTQYYEYTPESVIENKTHLLYWDRTILSDKEAIHNRPDITVFDKEKKKVQFIDMAIPSPNNMQTVYAEKIRKYGELARQVKRLWNAEEVVIIPIIISSNGLIHKELMTGLKKIGLPAYLCVKLQKAVIIRSCSLVREFLGEL